MPTVLRINVMNKISVVDIIFGIFINVLFISFGLIIGFVIKAGAWYGVYRF